MLNNKLKEMNNLTITKEFKWDCAHKLFNPYLSEKANKDEYGLCSNIHGHTYHMFITVSLEKDDLDNGMIINFKDLKRIVTEEIVDEQDHSLNLTKGDIIIDKLEGLGLKINVVDYETTCENQVRDYWNRLDRSLRLSGVVLEEIKLYETETSYATLKR